MEGKKYAEINITKEWQRMKDFKFNIIDAMILINCYPPGRSISDLQKDIDIARKNLLPHIESLSKYRLTKIENKGKGKPKIVTTNIEDEKVNDLVFGLASYFGLLEVMNPKRKKK